LRDLKRQGGREGGRERGKGEFLFGKRLYGGNGCHSDGREEIETMMRREGGREEGRAGGRVYLLVGDDPPALNSE